MKSLCLCIELKAGCILIGMLEIMGYSLFLLKTVISLGGSELLSIKDVAEIDRDLDKIPGSEDEFKNVKRVVIQYSIQLVLNFVQLVAGILLVVGAIKCSEVLVKVWLSVKLKSFILSVILLAVSMATSRGSRSIVKDHWSDIISLVLGLYFLLVVFQFCLLLRKGTGQEKAQGQKSC